MGGKHFGSGRVSPATYLQLKPRMLDAAQHLFGEALIPREMPGKASYGDVDILLPSSAVTATRLAEFAAMVGSGPAENASGAHSYHVPLTEAERAVNHDPQQTHFQVDLFARPDHLLRGTAEFMSDGELGNILSRQLRRWHLEWGMDGLRYVLRDPEDTHDLRTYPVGGMREVLRLLELSHDEWLRGFDSEEALFAWVQSSPHFNPEPYINLRGKSRARAKERPAMGRFVQQVQQRFPADSPYLDKLPPEQLVAALPELTGLLDWISKQKAAQQQKNERRRRFSGAVARTVWPELEGGGARNYMARLLAGFGSSEQLGTWLDRSSDDDVLAYLRAHPPTDEDLARSEQARERQNAESSKPSREEREQARQTRLRESARVGEIAAQRRALHAQAKAAESRSIPDDLREAFDQAEQALGLNVREHCVVWMTGSRTQGLHTEQSDTDYIVVHGPALLTAGPTMGLQTAASEWSPLRGGLPDNSVRFIPLWHFTEMLSAGVPDAVILAQLPVLHASHQSSRFIMELLAVATAGAPSERTYQTMVGHASSSLRVMEKQLPHLTRWPDPEEGRGKRAGLHPKYLMHAVRMALHARELAQSGTLRPTLGDADRELLMNIKRGEMHPSQVISLLNRLLSEMPAPHATLRAHDEARPRLQATWQRELQWLLRRTQRRGTTDHE